MDLKAAKLDLIQKLMSIEKVFPCCIMPTSVIRFVLVFPVFISLAVGSIACKKSDNPDTTVHLEADHLNPVKEYGEVTDIDGHQYATIIIGNQEWMAENLKTVSYANSDPIPFAAEDADWQSLSQNETGAYGVYSNMFQQTDTYGHLYNWYAVNDSRNICPEGWHVPSVTEWHELLFHLDSLTDTLQIGPQSQIAGGMLKTTGFDYWFQPNSAANNSSGFSGLPGGQRLQTGDDWKHGEHGYWYTSTPYSLNDAFYFRLYFDQSYVVRSFTNRSYGCSVRCVKN